MAEYISKEKLDVESLVRALEAQLQFGSFAGAHGRVVPIAVQDLKEIHDHLRRYADTLA